MRGIVRNRRFAISPGGRLGRILRISMKRIRTGDSTILFYLGFNFFQDLALIYPVYMIYFEQRGLDSLQISWLLAIWGVPVEEDLPAGGARRPDAGMSGILCSLGAVLRGKAFVPLVAFGVLATVVYGVLDEYDFLFGREYGVPVALIGFWGGLRFLMEGLGALVAHKLETRFGLDSPMRGFCWCRCRWR